MADQASKSAAAASLKPSREAVASCLRGLARLCRDRDATVRCRSAVSMAALARVSAQVDCMCCVGPEVLLQLCAPRAFADVSPRCRSAFSLAVATTLACAVRCERALEASVTSAEDSLRTVRLRAGAGAAGGASGAGAGAGGEAGAGVGQRGADRAGAPAEGGIKGKVHWWMESTGGSHALSRSSAGALHAWADRRACLSAVEPLNRAASDAVSQARSGSAGAAAGMARALGLGRSPELPPCDDGLPPPPATWDVPSALAWIRGAAHTAADGAGSRSARAGGVAQDPTAADPSTAGPVQDASGLRPPPTAADCVALGSHIGAALLRSCRHTLEGDAVARTVSGVLALARRPGSACDLFPGASGAERVLHGAAAGSSAAAAGGDPELAGAPLWVPWRPGGRLSAQAAHRRACAEFVLERGLLAPPDSLFRYLPGRWEAFQAAVAGQLAGVVAAEAGVLPPAVAQKNSYRATGVPVGVDGCLVGMVVLDRMIREGTGSGGAACPASHWDLAMRHVPDASPSSRLTGSAALPSLSIASSILPAAWKLATAPHPFVAVRQTALRLMRCAATRLPSAARDLSAIAIEAAGRRALLLADRDRLSQLQASAAASGGAASSSASS